MLEFAHSTYASEDHIWNGSKEQKKKNEKNSSGDWINDLT